MLAFVKKVFSDAAGSRAVKRHLKGLSSKRVVWNWLFLALLFAVCIYLTLTHPVECGPTIVMTLGTLVGAILTNYVWADYAQRKAGLNPDALERESETKIGPGNVPDGQ